MPPDIKNDLNDFMHRHLAYIVIWGGMILGGCLGWYTSSLIELSTAQATTEAKVGNAETNLQNHLDGTAEYRRDVRNSLNTIRDDVGEVKENVAVILDRVE